MKQNLLLIMMLFASQQLFAQFHTLTAPTSSPMVKETQRLAVTDITISYHSPALKGRDVWNNPNVIPQNGEPFAWRAGANMNTTIEFSTDVMIEGKTLPAGIYGLHIIPENDTFNILFAHNYQQWGSYYLDQEKDVSLKVTVTPTTCAKSEQLDFEFLDRTENSLIIGLEWGEKRIPFKVEVDLEKTVLGSFRNELRGLNTYRWEAWNDAAKWCLRHDTNLEEALEWANRSISGGYYGFAANKNMANMTTKAMLLIKLDQKEKAVETINEMKTLQATASQSNGFIVFLLNNQFYEDAFEVSETALKNNPDTWFLYLNRGISQYFLEKQSKAIKDIDISIELGPERFHKRLNEIKGEIKTGTYKL